MACMTSGASSVTLQSLYWRSSDNFSVPAESSRVNWCSPARGLEDEILESRSHEGEVWCKPTALRSILPATSSTCTLLFTLTRVKRWEHWAAPPPALPRTSCVPGCARDWDNGGAPQSLPGTALPASRLRCNG